ncbi:ComEA family DNA-binding protein [Phycisphaera mikurensis]|uniref:Helix-hairpin-helix domain-containing protein n=1 Tax=Phycisphaera mikurensis (strain NBRC 102666 / KCTC 22515 / FYK2301M01) TaxID=1142394 RepID=I0IHQ3_PHYMF|nr:helix-hairpin-helix domain-containing protein [Phycisphaera mikurensis]MBB6441035.1 DNA uptake protein ComE-like DNA-binding protein [Phycisphaera mikurensis]BAM04791.1 hypothetical protein PSMK_26320 [Phycisphaera mikurensis NBRC 102666]
MSSTTHKETDPPAGGPDEKPTGSRKSPIEPRGKQQVKPGGDAEAGRVVLTEADRRRQSGAGAGAATGVPHDEDEHLLVDDPADDSVDFLHVLGSDDAKKALQTAGVALAAVATLAGLAALVVAAVRDANDRDDRDGRAGGGRRAGLLAAGRAARTRFGQTDLNRASLTELQRVPGIGHRSAVLIVRHRPYDSVAEVREITGIRASAYRELRPHVKV